MKNKLLCVCLSLALSLAAPVQAFAEELEPVPAPDDSIMEEGGVSDISEDSDFGEAPGDYESLDTSDGMLLPDTNAPAGQDVPSDEDIQPDANIPAATSESESFDDEELTSGDDLPDVPSVIKVVVPDTGHVLVNPYKLEITSNSGVSRDQIIHEAQTIANYSDFPVVLNVIATGTIAPGSAAYFVSAVPASDSREKEIFMYAEFQTSAENWSDAYTGAPNQVLVTSEGSAKDGVLTLDTQGEGCFRLFGAMTTRANPMWNSDDTVTVTIAYTFSRDAAAPAAEPEPEPAAEPEEFMEPEDAAGAEQPAEPEDVTEPEQPTELEDVTELEPPVEPEDVIEVEESAELEDVMELEESAELEDVMEPEEIVVLEDETIPPPGTPLPYEDILELLV